METFIVFSFCGGGRGRKRKSSKDAMTDLSNSILMPFFAKQPQCFPVISQARQWVTPKF